MVMEWRPSTNIPKVINIVVERGENLEYSVPGSKKSAKTRQWRVLFIGDKRNQATDAVEAQDGCPVWSCEVTLEVKNPSDPIVMLVIDGKDRHVGQVVIPLSQVPQSGPPPLVPARQHGTDLEPTKKNSYPRGRLYYWIWAGAYWPPGTDAETLARPKSIRGSLSRLAKPFRSKHNVNSQNDSDTQSTVSGFYKRRSSKQHQLKAYPASVIGGSNGLSSSTRDPSLLAPNTPGSAIWDAEGISYNPFGSTEDTMSMSGRRTSDVDLPNPNTQSSWAIGVNSPPESIDDTGHSPSVVKKKSFIKRVQHKLSKSTHNLAEIAAGKSLSSRPSTNSKHGGQPSASPSQPALFTVGDFEHSRSITPVASVGNGSLTGQIIGSLSAHSNIPAFNGTDDHLYSGAHSRTPSSAKPPLAQARGSRFDDFGSSSLDSPSSGRGVHPEERPSKPIEEMSHRETAEFVTSLQKNLQLSRAEIVRLQMEKSHIADKAAVTEHELNEVRASLAALRNRLLQDNLTQYLELPGGGDPFHVGSRSTADFGRTFGAANLRRTNSIHTFPNQPPVSFGKPIANDTTNHTNGTSSSTDSQAILAKIGALAQNPLFEGENSPANNWW